MKRGPWFGVLAVSLVVLGSACGGGVGSLDAFQDRKFRIDYGFDTHDPQAPAGKGILTVLLQSRAFGCGQLADDVAVTVNGDSNVRVERGACGGLLGSANPLITWELQPGDTAQNATIVLSDASHRMEVEVENLLAAYRLQPEKAGFDPDLAFQQGANPVTRGEVLTFDRVPSLRSATFESDMSQETRDASGMIGRTDFDVHPSLDGAQARVTMPTNAADGQASLALIVTEVPTVLRCEGVSGCEAQVMVRVDTTVTVTP